MDADMVVRLEQGLWRDNARFAEASVRVLTGADETLIAGGEAAATPAARATMLVAAACRIEGIGSLTPDDARLLSVGDRERLLLALYRRNFGERFDAVVQCPAASCGETAELELAVESLLVPTANEPSSPEGAGSASLMHDITLATADGQWRVRFRVPNGGDQELAARVAASDAAGAGDRILERCVAEVRDASGKSLTVDEWLPVLRESLPESLCEIDQQANVTVKLRCPACETAITAIVDAGTFLHRELVGSHGIFVEVDRLARAYHWSESEILAMPVARRRRYLALVAGAN